MTAQQCAKLFDTLQTQFDAVEPIDDTATPGDLQ